jgi:hypothetical protein
MADTVHFGRGEDGSPAMGSKVHRGGLQTRPTLGNPVPGGRPEERSPTELEFKMSQALINLSKLARESQEMIESMTHELEGRSPETTWRARFIAIGLKKAHQPGALTNSAR